MEVGCRLVQTGIMGEEVKVGCRQVQTGMMGGRSEAKMQAVYHRVEGRREREGVIYIEPGAKDRTGCKSCSRGQTLKTVVLASAEQEGE